MKGESNNERELTKQRENAKLSERVKSASCFKGGNKTDNKGISTIEQRGIEYAKRLERLTRDMPKRRNKTR